METARKQVQITFGAHMYVYSVPTSLDMYVFAKISTNTYTYLLLRHAVKLNGIIIIKKETLIFKNTLRTFLNTNATARWALHFSH